MFSTGLPETAVGRTRGSDLPSLDSQSHRLSSSAALEIATMQRNRPGQTGIDRVQKHAIFTDYCGGRDRLVRVAAQLKNVHRLT